MYNFTNIFKKDEQWLQVKLLGEFGYQLKDC